HTGPRRPPAAVGAARGALFVLTACSPGAPPGVNRDELDAAVSRAIGDPNSCLLIARKGSGQVLYRYNAATVCDREFPACDRPQKTKVGRLLDATARDGQTRQLSCNTTTDASRGVGWAAGPARGAAPVQAAAA